RVLTFWRNGFSVEDGPLMAYDDPQNQELLEHIKNGRAPPSLLNVSVGQPVEVRVQHKLEEDYKAPPKVLKPFHGQGRALGSIVPGAETPSGAMPGSFPSAATSDGAAAPSPSLGSAPALQVDETQPITSLQIRLADGTRLVAKFNHNHTVGDLRRFVRSSRAEARSWALQTTFPVKELSDDTVTLKAAGLLNAVVVQKYT
ncbi:SEP-domain-containing protein, partial [Gonapodya prolifera JEL478]